MLVTVKLFATFRQGRFETARTEYPPGTSLANVVDELRIPKADIGLMLVSGRHANLEYELAPDDTISIFPLLGGG